MEKIGLLVLALCLVQTGYCVPKYKQPAVDMYGGLFFQGLIL